MKGLYFGPVMNVKHEREDHIEGSHKKSKEAAEKTAELDEHYRQELSKSNQSAQQLIKTKQDEARTKAASVVQEARDKAMAEINTNLESLQNQYDETYKTLDSEKETFIKAIVEKMKPSKSRSHAGVSSS